MLFIYLNIVPVSGVIGMRYIYRTLIMNDGEGEVWEESCGQIHEFLTVILLSETTEIIN
jgi:hypothetical protein